MADYTDDTFVVTGEGYYKVTYGGDPAPEGPFTTIREMALALDLYDYPDDGYILFYDAERRELGSVPSLNPDDLLPPSEDHP